MNELSIHHKDIQIYRKLIGLAQAQLASIQKRLVSDSGRLDKWLFLFRNLKIKKSILKILKLKESRVGEEASLAEMMDDYRALEANWQDVKKEELDYIRLIVHGLRDVTEKEEEKEE